MKDIPFFTGQQLSDRAVRTLTVAPWSCPRGRIGSVTLAIVAAPVYSSADVSTPSKKGA